LDIDFLSIAIHHCFQIARLKFTKFERDQNATEKFQVFMNESKKSLKLDKFIVYYFEIALTCEKIH